jgi:hypothetical protein
LLCRKLDGEVNEGMTRQNTPYYTSIAVQREVECFGTGFVISNRMANRLLEFEAIRERICGIRIKGRF